MLFKWIVLTVIAWYIFRAAGNLITAARGGQQPIDGRAPSSTHDESPIQVVKKRPAGSSTSVNRDEDVEDAQFTDL
jgi:hypothetical protein